ncbi:hypothetical protein [Xanthomonas phage JGB6]|nr:hypothetical protein [Xanthomonas phage JGB6]
MKIPFGLLLIILLADRKPIEIPSRAEQAAKLCASQKKSVKIFRETQNSNGTDIEVVCE